MDWRRFASAILAVLLFCVLMLAISIGLLEYPRVTIPVMMVAVLTVMVFALYRTER